MEESILIILQVTLTCNYRTVKSMKSWDFPGGAVVKNPPAKQGTRVQALVWEDPTCHGATKPVRHNYWSCALEPKSHNYWTCVPQLVKAMHLEPMLHNKRRHSNEKPAHFNEE